jgi:hypothetical protein
MGRKSQHSDKATIKPTTLEKGWGLGHTVVTAAQRLFKQSKKRSKQRMCFASNVDVQECSELAIAT